MHLSLPKFAWLSEGKQTSWREQSEFSGLNIACCTFTSELPPSYHKKVRLYLLHVASTKDFTSSTSSFQSLNVAGHSSLDGKSCESMFFCML